MTTRFTRIVPILRIFDISKAREFYLDFLGCKVDWEHRYAPDLPLFMQVSLGEVILHLSGHHGDCSPGAKITIEMTGLAAYHADCRRRNTVTRGRGLSRSPGARPP